MGKIMHGGISYSGGGGSGGASAMSELTDVELTNLADGQILKYDAANQKWVNNNESGGTIVIANPSGTPTDELETIQIGEDIYEIVGGGGGGGNFEVTELWENTTGAGTGEQTLSSSIDDFDLLSIWCGVYAEYTGSPYIIQQCMISVSELNDLYSSSKHFVFSGYDNRATYMDFYGNKVNVTNVYNNQRLLKVLGVKCGGGSSGSGYSRTNLWSGEQRGPMEVPLSDDINNYDAIELVTKISSNGAYNTIIVDAKSFSTKYPYSASVSQNIPHYCLLVYDNLFGRVITGQTTSSLYIWDLTSTMRLAEVNGIKYETGGGESKDKYSTEETVVGEWIDGKPIYRLVFKPWENGVLQSGYTYSNYILSDSPFKNVNAELVTNVRIINVRSGSSGYIDVNGSGITSQSGTGNDTVVPNTDGTIFVRLANAASNNKTVYIILEYTKTTD